MNRVLNRWIRALAGRAESMEGLETRALMAATTFDAATTLLASGELRSVVTADINGAAADMNGDGAGDILSVDRNQTLGVYFADKDRRGEFALPVSIGLPSNVEDFAVVDWDGDGDRDVVLAPANGPDVLLVERLPNGVFGSAVTLTSVSAMGSNRRLVVGNFTTGDTRPDIVVADDTGRVVLRTRTASNGFNAETVLRPGGIGDRVEDLASGDFDGDGDLDLAVGVPGVPSSSVLTYRNSGNGVFQAGQTLPAGRELAAIAVGRLNGDSRWDLAVVGSADLTTVQTYLSINAPGTMSFASGLNQSFANGTGVAIGDVDQDGDGDVVVGSGGGYTVVYRTNPGAVVSREEYRISVSGLSLANVDGEAGLDLVGMNASGVAIGFNYGSGSFAGAPLVTQSPAFDIESMVVADIDGDNDDDLLASSSQEPGVLLYRNLGGYYQLPESISPLDPEGKAVGDINGDGLPDLAMLDQDTGRITLRIASSPGVLGPETLGLQLDDGISGWNFTIADINQDRRGDVVFLAGWRTIGVALGTALNGGGLESPMLYEFTSELNGLRGFAVGDLDADGAPDIAVMETLRVGVLKNDGRGQFGPVASRLVLPLVEQGGNMGIAQIEGGALSRLDIVYRNDTGGLAWLRNTSSIGQPLSFAQGAGWSGLSGAFDVVDFDGDGDDDLFENFGDRHVRLVRNDGALGFTPMSPIGRRQNGPSAVGRIDGNSTPDILVTIDGADRTDDFATLMNIGNGNFLAADRVVHREVGTLTMMRAGDLNGDMLDDVVVIGHDQGKVTRLTNTGAGLSAAQQFNAGTTWGVDLAIGNFNGAGLNDILVLDGDSANRRLMLLAANGQGGYSAPVRVWVEPSGAPLSFTAMATGDVDRDGDLDAVLIQWDTGRFVVVRNNGASAWDTYSDVQTVQNPTAIVLADLDGDGDLDAAISGGGGQGGVAFHYNAPTGLPPGRFSPFDPQAAIGGMNTPETLAVGDLDGDQRLDLAVGLGGPGAVAEVQLLKNTSASGVITFTRTNTQRLSTQNNEIPTLQLVDVDGDNRRDIVAGQQGTITVFRNVPSGQGYTLGGSQTFAARGWWVAPLNINGDGISDFVGMGGDGTVSTVVSLKRNDLSLQQIQVSDLIASPFHTKLRAQFKIANAGFLRGSSIGDGDFVLRTTTGPFYQPGTFVGASVQPDDSTILTFDFPARLGAWDSTDNARYLIEARANALTTTGGLSFPSANAMLWQNDLWFNAPTAAWLNDGVVEGGTSMDIAVRYTDAARTPSPSPGISWDSITDGDIVLEREVLVNGSPVVIASIPGALVSRVTAGNQLTATYRFAAPGGYWDNSDNAQWTARVVAGQVIDTDGYAVAGIPLRTYGLYFSAPTARVASFAATINSPTVTVTMQYQAVGSVLMDTSSFGNGDIELRGPNNYNAQGTWLSSSSSVSGGRTLYTVSYSFPAPGGVWLQSNQNLYTVWTMPSQVRDASMYARPVPALAMDMTPTARFNSFVVNPGAAAATITVDYQALGTPFMSWDTLGNSDIELRGPDGFVSVATMLSKNAIMVNGAFVYRVVYSLAAPGGSWNRADNGNYSVWTRSNQVQDNAGRLAASVAIDWRSLWFPSW